MSRAGTDDRARSATPRRVDRGATVVELLVVAAIIAVACAMGVMLLATASRTSALRQARAEVSARIRQSAAEAAKTGRTIRIDLWGFPVGQSVRIRTGAPAPLPETAAIVGTVELQGGTGYPFANGSNRAVAVVLEDASDPSTFSAVVLGPSGTVTEYRLDGQTWEVMP